MTTTAAPVPRAPLPRREAARAWWRRHRSRVDDVVAVAVVVLGAGVVVVGDVATGLDAWTWWRAGLTLALAAGMWWRRRHPLLLALVVCAAVAAGASEAALAVALATLAVRRRDRVLLLVGAAAVLAYVVAAWRSPTQVDPVARAVSAAVSGVVFVGFPIALGAYVGARRALLTSLRERAERAEAEQVLRVDQTRLAERTRIAQEMHDVLAHRISLVALHAGGLEVNPAAPPQDVERSAALIRTTARQALEDLRGVLGVLRADGSADGADLAPQPSVADVPRLVAASTQAGVVVRLSDELPAGAQPPLLQSRTAYRVVQEGLTNVHKHAQGAVAAVHLCGGPGTGLVVRVGNARPVGGTASPLVPGAGLGLVGLRERVELAGGSLEAGPDADGGFAVTAHLPWPAGAGGAA